MTRCLLEFQLHTMVRSSEVAKASWDEIDFENMLWEIPAERIKNESKSKTYSALNTASIGLDRAC